MRRRSAAAALVACELWLACGCGAPRTAPADPRVEATSLMGRPLVAPEPAEEFRLEQEGHLARAHADLAEHPDDPEARIWVGRRTAYLGRYRESIEIYTEGIERHPEDARFLRHRGHRYITTRRFADAVRDLERAAEMIRGVRDTVEPDGLPNARNIPTGTLGTNVWYHLGLARYLLGDFEGALEAYSECLMLSDNPDMLSATSHWLYMTLRRLGRDEQARVVLEPINAEMDIIENHAYHLLLLMYRGEREPRALLDQASADDGSGLAATAYGVGNWYLYNGEPDRAREIFERVVDAESWAAFGTIAAEAELAAAR